MTKDDYIEQCDATIDRLRAEISTLRSDLEKAKEEMKERCAKVQCEYCREARPLHKPAEWMDERHEWDDESGFHIQECDSIKIRALPTVQAETKEG